MSALQKLGDYCRERPTPKASGKPVSLYTAKNHLDTARRFVRWLERYDGYAYTSKSLAGSVVSSNVSLDLSMRASGGRDSGTTVIPSRSLYQWL